MRTIIHIDPHELEDNKEIMYAFERILVQMLGTGFVIEKLEWDSGDYEGYGAHFALHIRRGMK